MNGICSMFLPSIQGKFKIIMLFFFGFTSCSLQTNFLVVKIIYVYFLLNKKNATMLNKDWVFPGRQKGFCIAGPFFFYGKFLFLQLL